MTRLLSTVILAIISMLSMAADGPTKADRSKKTVPGICRGEKQQASVQTDVRAPVRQNAPRRSKKREVR